MPTTQPIQTSYELPPPSCCLCMTFGHESIDCIEFPNLPEQIQHQVLALNVKSNMQRLSQAQPP